MSKKLPVNGFKWLDSDKINEINEEFIKKYNENDNKGYIFEVDVKIQKDYTNYIVIYRSYQNEWK